MLWENYFSLEGPKNTTFSKDKGEGATDFSLMVSSQLVLGKIKGELQGISVNQELSIYDNRLQLGDRLPRYFELTVLVR
jgi:hypothetical protein